MVELASDAITVAAGDIGADTFARGAESWPVGERLNSPALRGFIAQRPAE